MLPSASALTRAINCPSSEVLTPRTRRLSIYGEHGTGVHSIIRKVLGGMSLEQAVEDLPGDDSARLACQRMDFSVFPTGGMLEVAFAWNWKTHEGRVLGQDIQRGYAAAGADLYDDYPGSADFAGVNGDCAVVVDWKNGWKTPRAKDSWQRALGMFAADTFKVPRARFAHLDLRDPEDPRWDVVEMDEFDLIAIRGRLAALAQTIDGHRQTRMLGVPLDVSIGPWCRYCEAFEVCPGQTGLARQMLPELALAKVEQEIREMAPADVATLIQRLEQYDAIRGRIQQFIDAYSERCDIPVGDGRVYSFAPGRSVDQITDTHKALKVVAEVCDATTAQSATMVSTSKGAIEEAVRVWAKENGRKIGESQKRVFEKMRTSGVIKKVVGERKPRFVKALSGGTP